MNIIEGESNRPLIKVYLQKSAVSAQDISLLLSGIEEEGIPYQIEERDERVVLQLAFQACNDSRLGVGVGVSENEAALHFEKLDPDSPLFRIRWKVAPEQMRALGANAARLVKRMPFKEIGGDK